MNFTFMHFSARKKIVLLITILAIVGTLVPSVFGRVKPYYSGRATSYNGQVVFATTNSGTLELFKLVDSKIQKTASLKPEDIKWTEFHDVAFRTEQGRLYMYAVNGNLYKYDITDPNFPILKYKIKDNSWDYFYGLDIAGERLVTIGSKGIKFWNNAAQVVSSISLKAKIAHNISFSSNGTNMFYIEDKTLSVYDTVSGATLSSFAIVSNASGNRAVYNDASDSSLYLVDDDTAKKVSFDGTLLAQFDHTSHVGYDVVAPSTGTYVYFSDGIGIVKADKTTMEAVDWAYTNSLGLDNAWSMGLATAKNTQGLDRVIAFAGGHIIALDDSLKVLDSYTASEEDLKAQEDLFLAIDKNRSAPGGKVSLRGGGFGINEKIQIVWMGEKIDASTDDAGRFTKIVTVPEITSKRLSQDIKVNGLRSGLTYSISFNIE